MEETGEGGYSHVDRSFVNIGPSVKSGLRTKTSTNQGQGEIIGDHNFQTNLGQSVDDRDFLDLPFRKEVLR